MTHDHLKSFIESAYDHAGDISSKTKGVVRDAVEETLDLLDKGEARVAEKIDGQWVVHQWLKKAILLSFRLNDPQRSTADLKAALGSTRSRLNLRIGRRRTSKRPASAWCLAPSCVARPISRLARC